MIITDSAILTGDIVDKAYAWTSIFHSSQRYLKDPYTKHLRDVTDVLFEFNFYEDDLLASAWLHDILEDTPCPLALLIYEFGNDIAQLVHAVSDGKAGTRRKRKAEAYEKMQLLPRATIVKLADKIANVRVSLASDSEYLEMYRREHHLFSNSLPKLAETELMWLELERLLG